MTKKRIVRVKEIKNKYEEDLLKKKNVVGVMTGYKTVGDKKTRKLSVVCMVEDKVDLDNLEVQDAIPPNIEDVLTDVIKVGKLKALQTRVNDRQDKHRPCPMGTSGGHYAITAGTNGELLIDNSGQIYIGTNNHVGADSNDGSIGDKYLQPGAYDDGKDPEDVIGFLFKFEPIKFLGGESGCKIANICASILNKLSALFGHKTRLKPMLDIIEYNLIDGAIIGVNANDVLPEILDIGIPKGYIEPKLNMKVQKSGRTTGHTTNGVITGLDATVGPVSYAGNKLAYFKEQIIISGENFSAGGDSGSLILDHHGYAIGKLFAGNDQENITIANTIENYLDILDVNLITES